MGIKDAHDRRPMQHYAKLDGRRVVAMVEFADGSFPPDGHPTDSAGSLYINVTEHYPYDFEGVQLQTPIDPTRPDRVALAAELGRLNKVKRG
jgi:hypothetical protein